jgi:hypothetical protein
LFRPGLINARIAHVRMHATKDENESRAGRPCHFIFKGGGQRKTMSMMGNLKQISASTLEEIKSDPSILEEILFSEDAGAEGLEIEKAWHGLHYLLTGIAWGGDPPLANAVLGGEEIGEDWGYGAVRYLTPAQVQEVAAALSKISEEDLTERFDPEAMSNAQIYGITGDDDDLEYLLEYFRPLVEYYQDASQKGNAMLLYLI